MPELKKIEKAMPVAPLKIIAMKSAQTLGDNINRYLVEFRKDTKNAYKSDKAFESYTCDNYLLDAITPRFNSGEAKGELLESVRGTDLYIIVDVTNHSIEYEMHGYTNYMSPDDHYQDLKRLIAACNGKAHRINVIMPFLYEGRQHKRSGRESLDCACLLLLLKSQLSYC